MLSFLELSINLPSENGLSSSTLYMQVVGGAHVRYLQNEGSRDFLSWKRRAATSPPVHLSFHSLRGLILIYH